MAQIHTGPSMLEIEAAHYFELDPKQLNLCQDVSKSSKFFEPIKVESPKSFCRKCVGGHSCASHHQYNNSNNIRSHRGDHHSKNKKYLSGTMPKRDVDLCQRRACAHYRPKLSPSRAAANNQNQRSLNRNEPESNVDREQLKSNHIIQIEETSPRSKAQNEALYFKGAPGPTSSERPAHRPRKTPDSMANKSIPTDQLHTASIVCNGSSIASTNSLPSISSSPSISPSIVCPHVSLDELLDLRQVSGCISPHTIGLCSRCRLHPPPNIHSPLSPIFRPFVYEKQAEQAVRESRFKMNQSTGDLRLADSYSEHTQNKHRSQLKHGMGSRQADRYRKSRSLSNVTSGNAARGQGGRRDDSLDFSLEPGDLRRLQMSPTLRNSVEFIRKNSIESGRVMKIYKNGEPFEKPLRVCVLRGEFANIDHFLDHINSRLLVPLGARYLFHLDGQLVYSVEELKHGSIYIVSGTRCFDYRASNQLREQHKKEMEQKASRSNKDSKLVLFPHAPRSVDDAHDSKGSAQEDRIAHIENSATADDAREIELGKKCPARRQAIRHKPLSQAEKIDSGALMSCESLTFEKDEPKPVELTRAKSEFSALPKKQKKNVTFMDTGRGSSPAISDTHSLVNDRAVDGVRCENREAKAAKIVSMANEKPLNRIAPRFDAIKTRKTAEIPRQSIPSLSEFKGFSTNDVGIQVSDSIDGFLIDLPVALPAKGDDSNLRQERRFVKRQSGRAAKTMRAAQVGGGNKKRQIVTIRERQLSLDEMSKLKDLSQGDHHHDTVVKGGSSNVAMEKGIGLDEATRENEVWPQEAEVQTDGVTTIAASNDSQINTSARTLSSKEEASAGQIDSSRLVASVQVPRERMRADNRPIDEHWQYLGGRSASVTPTERPVSQSGPSETVRARVTTPTPSLSTTGGGDGNSLSMSYENSSLADSQPTIKKPRGQPMKAPSKRRVEVTGVLCSGLHVPRRNFRLVWVNGFSINDLYPVNSVNENKLTDLAKSSATHLVPSDQRGRAGKGGAPSSEIAVFNPSERYNNWICHSRRHNELIFPAGSLIVLWCQWTNEQRFYSAHTANVSAVALATLDLDLAASAQVCQLHERPQIKANVHLWSIGDLNTLMIIEDDQMSSKLIFSLRLKNARSSGCELSIGAHDEKQLLLLTFKRKLVRPETSEAGECDKGKQETDSAKDNLGKVQALADVSVRAIKPLQSNQMPLFIMRVPKVASELRQQDGEIGGCEPLISFGRRCFQIWWPDVKQKKLRLMQPDVKSTRLSNLLNKANCLCRLSPSELLIGDADGNVALLATNLYAISSARGTSKRQPAKAPAIKEACELKYGIETIPLLGPMLSKDDGTSASDTNRPVASITCLTRVTGSLFISADASCAVRFWKIQQQPGGKATEQNDTSAQKVKLSSDISSKGSGEIQCEQLASISLPSDLGFVCSILLSNYNRVDSLVEFYIVSTCNTILSGSVKLKQSANTTASRENTQRELLANSSLSVVYEGHETSASNLVADHQLGTRAQMILNKAPKDYFYFTCSLDCRICKWNGRQLIWKSLLPSACVSLAVHPNGFVLAAGSNDGTVYIIDKISGLLISYFPLTPVRINCLAYSSDGSLLAAGCDNGSIFILPVYERGLKYKKVSIFQSPNAVVSLQFSIDNRYMLTSVTHGSFQELILWDLPNFRYMRNNVKLVADKIKWFDSICSGSEDVRAIWENANMINISKQEEASSGGRSHKFNQRRPASLSTSSFGGPKRVELERDSFVINLSCHRLIKTEGQRDTGAGEENYVIASDTRGFLRLFRYPSYDIEQGFYAVRISSTAINCCRFLKPQPSKDESPTYFVSSSLDGSICLWTLE